jgi:hypothetical protein
VLTLTTLASMISSAPPAAAATPPWTHVVQSSSFAAWGFMEQEARDLLIAHGVPQGRISRGARDEVRAYLVTRLIDIIETPESKRTAQEQAAVNHLVNLVHRERGWAANSAYNRFLTYSAPGNCESSDGPQQAFNIQCALFGAFSNNPGVIAFTAAGFEETFREFMETRASVSVIGTIKALDYWQGAISLGVTEGPEAAIEHELRAIYAEKVASEATKEVLSESVAALVEGIQGEFNPVGAAILVLSVAAILAYAIWNAYSFDDTKMTLLERKSSAATEAVKLGQLAEPEGMSELLMVVVAQTLNQDNSGGGCSFASARSCSEYRFADDPDFTDARYAGVTEPGHTATDPHFVLQKRGATGTQISTDLSTGQRAMRLWTGTTLIDTDPANYGIAPNWDPTATRMEAPRAIAYQGSRIVNGMFVNDVDGYESSSWRFATGVDYVDWKGEWWNAWLEGNTLLQTRFASPVPGTLTPTDEVSIAGIIPLLDGCVENPPFYAGVLEGSNPIVLAKGTCLLASKDSNLSGVHVGDRLLVLGVVREVKKVTSCYRVTVPAPFQTVEAQCKDHAGTALILKPTGSKIENDAVASSLADWGWRLLGVDLVGFGQPDSLVMRLADSDLCRGYSSCPYPNGDVRNCFRPDPGTDVNCFASKSIQYQMLNTSTSGFEDWTGTMVPALRALADHYRAKPNVAGGPNATLTVSAANGLLSNDVRPTKTAVLVDGPSHGALHLNPNGSFTYLADLGLGVSTPRIDTFHYRICDDGKVVPGDPVHCSTAGVTITISAP